MSRKRITVEEYYKKPNICRECGQMITIEDKPGGLHQAKVKKFCNSSCAAKFNNVKYPKRERAKPRPKIRKLDTAKKVRKNTSAVWTVPKDALRSIVANAKSLRDIFRAIRISMNGRSYYTIKERMENDKIDYSHIPLGHDCNAGKKFPGRPMPLAAVMIENSTYHRGNLKIQLLKQGILENKCSVCGITEWRGKPLVMRLDHINGICNDHRLENLRMLCPNCDSQSLTFCGRNVKRLRLAEKERWPRGGTNTRRS